jgi:serine acetyltransferase
MAAFAALLSSRGLWMLTFHRIIHFSTTRCLKNGVSRAAIRVLEGFSRYCMMVICKAEIREDVEIGTNVYLPDKGYLVFGPVSVGAETVVHDHVTCGRGVGKGNEGRPTIGEGVWIGPNSIVVGPVTIGDGATILSQSYVTFDVPARAVVRGNPARIVRRDFDNASLRRSLEIFENVEVQR